MPPCSLSRALWRASPSLISSTGLPNETMKPLLIKRQGLSCLSANRPPVVPPPQAREVGQNLLLCRQPTGGTKLAPTHTKLRSMLRVVVPELPRQVGELHLRPKASRQCQQHVISQSCTPNPSSDRSRWRSTITDIPLTSRRTLYRTQLYSNRRCYPIPIHAVFRLSLRRSFDNALPNLPAEIKQGAKDILVSFLGNAKTRNAAGLPRLALSNPRQIARALFGSMVGSFIIVVLTGPIWSLSGLQPGCSIDRLLFACGSFTFSVGIVVWYARKP